MIKNLFTFPAILTIPLLLAGFSMALFFHGTQDPLFAPQVACFSLMGFILLCACNQRGWDVPKSATVAAILAYWLFLFIALQWSTTPYISTYFFFIFSLMPFLFFSLIMAHDPRRACAIHAGAIITVIAAAALWAVVQFLFFYAAYGPRIRHPFLDPNSLTGLLNLGFLPALAFFMVVRRRIYKIAGAAAVCLFYAALVVTQSRAGMIASLTSVFVLLPFLSRPLHERGFKLLAVLAIGLFVPYALWLYSDMAYSRDLGRAFTGGGMVSMTDRGAIWQATAAMIADHFWTGTGLASFFYYYSAYRLPGDSSDGFFAHMDPLQFWAEMGVGAPLLFYTVLIAILARTIRALNKTTMSDTALRAKILGPFCALLALVLHTHLNYHLYMPALCVPMAVLLAYWYAATEEILKDARLSFVPRNALLRYALPGFVCFVLGIAVLWSIRAAISSYNIAAAEESLYYNQPDKARHYVEAASRWGPRSAPLPPQYEAKWRQTKLLLQGNAMDETQKRALYDEALAFLDEAQRRQPSFSFIHNARAKLYFVAQGQGLITDGNDRAIAELDKVLKADPLNLDARTGLANIYLHDG